MKKYKVDLYFLYKDTVEVEAENEQEAEEEALLLSDDGQYVDHHDSEIFEV